MTAVQTAPAVVEALRNPVRAQAAQRWYEFDVVKPQLFETVEYINAAMRAQRLPADS